MKFLSYKLRKQQTGNIFNEIRCSQANKIQNKLQEIPYNFEEIYKELYSQSKLYNGNER